MGIFERYLSVWIGISICLDVFLGSILLDSFSYIAKLEWAHVNFVVAVIIWVMIYPIKRLNPWSLV